MDESIAEFMNRQRRKVARFGREAESAAHEAYGRAIRAGQDLKLSSPGEVMRHGAKLLEEKANGAAALASDATRMAKREAGESLRRASRNPAVRSLAVDMARGGGNAVGVVRGGVHAVQGLAEGATFANRLLNPSDSLMSPRGESASERLGRGLLGAGQAAAGYIGKVGADPERVLRDVEAVGQQWRRELDPSATPVARTFEGELRRNFDIGQNQGELAFDVGSLVVGGPAAKGVKGLGHASNVGNVERYVAQGFSPRAAAHLSEPYPSRGMGHHFIPRRKGLPKSYGDSVFNVLKPEGISRGDFYELHYKIDPRFSGGKVVGRENWRGMELGLKRYGPAGRVWFGSPPPLKARVGGLGATAGAVMYARESEEPGR